MDVIAALGAVDLAAVAGARWYADKADGAVTSADLVDALPLPAAGAALALVEIRTAAETSGLYSFPLRTQGPPGEASADHPVWRALAEMVAAGAPVPGACGGVFAATAGLGEVPGGAARALDPDQSNTSVVLGESLVLKLYRRLEPGSHPEVTALSALDVPTVPRFRGSLAYRPRAGEEIALLVLQDLVAHAERGWEAYIARLLSTLADGGLETALEDAERFAKVAGELHVALGSALGITRLAGSELAARRAAAEERVRQAEAVVPKAGRLAADLAAYDEVAGAAAVLVHGDLHVAQFLRRPDGSLAVVDFEGEPGRPLAERSAPWTPMWDLATLLLSFENAAAAARRRLRADGRDEAPLDAWLAAAGPRALAAYETLVAETPLAPSAPLLRASLAEKQATELLYAARQLPEWLYAPLEVLERRWG
jgi:maltokinase